MGIVRTKIGDADVVIEDANMSGKSATDYQSDERMSETNISESAQKFVDDAFDKIEDALEDIVKKGSSALASIGPGLAPDKVKMTFTIGYDAKVNALAIKADGSLTFNVEITWKPNNRKSSEKS